MKIWIPSKLIWFTLISVLWISEALAQTSSLPANTSLGLTAGARSYPLSASAEVSAKYDFQLWGEKKTSSDFKYGFLQAKLALATHGMVEYGASVFPISFFEIGYFKSNTNRTYDSRVLDCSIAECRDEIRRERLQVKMAAAVGDYVFLPSYQKIITEHSTKNQVLVDEMENLYLQAGGEPVEVYLLFVGRKFENGLVFPGEDKTFGILAKQAKTMTSSYSNQSQYLVLRLKDENSGYNIGLGRYQSSFTNPQFSTVFLYTNQWGQGLGLF